MRPGGVTGGGDCQADIATLREALPVFGLMASDPTVSRPIDTLAGDADQAPAGIDAARATARKTVWTRAGVHTPDHGADHRAPLAVDVGATLVTAHSDKKLSGEKPQTGITYSGVRDKA